MNNPAGQAEQCTRAAPGRPSGIRPRANRRVCSGARRGPVSLVLSAAFLLLFAASLPWYACAQGTAPALQAIVQVDKRSVYEHEEFTITLLLHNIDVSLEREIDIKGLPGADRIRYSEFKELRAERSVVRRRHKITRRFVCRAHALGPGVLRIAPVLRVGILKRPFFSLHWTVTHHDIAAPAVTLDVKPLPQAGRPEGFSGGVGQFLFDAEVAPTDVAVGDIVKLTLAVRGQGNLEGLRMPRVSPGRHFKAYDPRSIPGTQRSEVRSEQAIVPQSTNAVAVPAVSFSYFDPLAKAYRTVTRGPFRLTFHAPRLQTDTVYRPAVTNRAHPAAMPTNPSLRRATASWLSELGRAGQEHAAATRDARVRFAPAHSAMVLFELRKGSEVRILETVGQWAKIESDARRGWIFEEDLTPADSPATEND